MVNAKAVVGMNNTFAAFINDMAAGELEKHIEEFLYPSNDIWLMLPVKNMEIKGAAQVRAALLSEFSGRGVHLLHTAAYDTEAGEADEAKASWNTYSYMVDSEAEDGCARTIRYGFYRFTIDFKRDSLGRWLIKRFYILPLMFLDPWKCDMPDVAGVFQSPDQKLVRSYHPFNEINSVDFVKIRNVAGMFMQYGPMHSMAHIDETDITIDMFNISDQVIHGKADAAKFFESWLGRDMEGGYLNHKLTLTNTVITYIKDCDHAVLHGMSQIFDSKVLDNKTHVFQAIRRIAAVTMSFVRRENSWKIQAIRLVPVVSLNREVNDHARMLEAMPSRVPDYFPDMDLDDAGLRAEDVFEIESILPQWTERLKRGVDMTDFPDLYMVNGCEDIRLSMRQVYMGYEAVRDRCDELINRQIKGKKDMLRYPQFHSGCTPVIVSNGKYGQAIWDDICWGNIGAAIFYDDSQKNREYLPGVGQYTHSFVKCKDGWKIYSLADRSQGVLPMVDWKYNIDRVGGWSAVRIPKQWPLPLECPMA